LEEGDRGGHGQKTGRSATEEECGIICSETQKYRSNTDTEFVACSVLPISFLLFFSR
jgi:hypothetical protein